MRLKANVAVALAAFSLAGCAKVKDSLSISGTTPDEFSVVGSQPLSMPPEFRLPAPGSVTAASRLRESNSRLTPSMLRGEDGGASSRRMRATDGENRFLSNIGASNDNASIRDELSADERRRQEERRSKKRFLPSLTDEGEPEPSVVNASAERRRIQESAEKGEEISGDGAVVKEKRKSGILGKWLGW